MSIEFVTEPKVYITGIMQPHLEGIDKFFADRGQDGKAIPRDRGPETCVVLGSRTCYESYDRGRGHDEHCRHLIESGHGSTTEHAVFQVVLTGISRDCGRQLLRHRHLSPSESSQRYCDKSEVRFVVPPIEVDDCLIWEGKLPRGQYATLTKDAVEAAKYRFHEFFVLCRDSAAAYTRRLAGAKTKKQKEAARSRLLGSVQTTIVFSGNVRAFRNLYERRCTEAADAEIRRVCCRLFDEMRPYFPNLLADYERRELDDGTFELTSKYRAA